MEVNVGGGNKVIFLPHIYPIIYPLVIYQSTCQGEDIRQKFDCSTDLPYFYFQPGSTDIQDGKKEK